MDMQDKQMPTSDLRGTMQILHFPKQAVSKVPSNPLGG